MNRDAFLVPVSLALVGVGICQMVLCRSRLKRAIRCNGEMGGINGRLDAFFYFFLNTFGFLYDLNMSEYNMGDNKKYIPHESGGSIEYHPSK
jgi:hypothetical protein